MRRCIPLLILLMCRHVGAQEPAAAPPILVLGSGGHWEGALLGRPDACYYNMCSSLIRTYVRMDQLRGSSEEFRP